MLLTDPRNKSLEKIVAGVKHVRDKIVEVALGQTGISLQRGMLKHRVRDDFEHRAPEIIGTQNIQIALTDIRYQR